MSERVFFITGAGSGMGQLAARQALEAGHAVAVLDRNPEGLEALGSSPRLLKMAVDVTDPKAVHDAVDRTEAELGPITRVVNAAAIMPLGLLIEQDQNLVHRIMAINYGGLVNVSRAVLPRMLARREGEFVSFASLAGHAPTIYMGAYNASKFAVCAYTEVLHHENRGKGVQIVCVCPPAVVTPLLNQARDTVWPKMLDQFPAIQPQTVLDRIEQALVRDQFWVFPDWSSRWSYRIRRLCPGLLWSRVHQVEGR